MCMPNITVCGDGASLVGDKCMPNITGCGDGANLVNGICVPHITGCGNGTHLVDGKCVPQTMEVANDDGSCPCIDYCRRDWSGQMRLAGWKGGFANEATSNGKSVSVCARSLDIPTRVGNPLHCTCQRDDLRPFWKTSGAQARAGCSIPNEGDSLY